MKTQRLLGLNPIRGGVKISAANAMSAAENLDPDSNKLESVIQVRYTRSFFILPLRCRRLVLVCDVTNKAAVRDCLLMLDVSSVHYAVTAVAPFKNLTILIFEFILVIGCIWRFCQHPLCHFVSNVKHRLSCVLPLRGWRRVCCLKRRG